MAVAKQIESEVGRPVGSIANSGDHPVNTTQAPQQFACRRIEAAEINESNSPAESLPAPMHGP